MSKTLISGLAISLVITSCGGGPYPEQELPAQQSNSGNSRLLPDGSVYIGIGQEL